MRRLIFGCGYLGSRVARLWSEQGDQVVAVTRNAQRIPEFSREGWTPVVADVTEPESLHNEQLAEPADTLLFAVGFDRSARTPIHQVYAEGLRNVLRAVGKVQRVLYISSTGVYGHARGDWVDEETTPAPARQGGKASLAAEDVLRQSPLAGQGIVLRLAGIYGPERLPYLTKMRSGEPIPARQTGWLNLIHVHDAARVVLAAAGLENASQLYCVSDGSPALRSDYYAEAARLLGVESPRFVDPPRDSPRAARAAADRRVANKKLLAETNLVLAYPSYREGLAHVLGNPRPSG